eukprot:CAMPEP_0202415252 /NCGR_PEP_ID=MMETSP1128-20130828/35493_1 /ASSEMBLY_ACC=CAM_ASM_000463 /TAXON_ID=3047 /ORGANISM="Dunaliella tertiolecta, Strain CCMP1320" /LENGTH=80 /DNA_ID=CAMNT_0049021885 /DNA_START=332 /DNA_END=574 /DNA_ORIENTATION=-
MTLLQGSPIAACAVHRLNAACTAPSMPLCAALFSHIAAYANAAPCLHMAAYANARDHEDQKASAIHINVQLSRQCTPYIK